MKERLLALLAWTGIAVTSIFSLAQLFLSLDVLRANPSEFSDILNGLITGFIGGVIALKRRHNWIGWICLLISVSLSVSGFAERYSILALPYGFESVPGAVPLLWLSQVIWIGLFLGVTMLLHLFPTGEPLNARWRVVILVTLFAQIALFFFFAVASPMTFEAPNGTTFEVPNPIGLLTVRDENIYLVLLVVVLIIPTVLSLIAMILRFLQARGIERQQMKWLLFAATIYVATLLVSFFVQTPFLDALITLVALGMPIAVGIALFRYRLHDIDFIIRRTVTYALVSALLLGIFAVSVIVLQQVLATLTGTRQNELVTVISTLVIAALFVPLRRRVQQVIDQRFNRRKYDAQRVLTEYANTLRDETDLERLTGRLVQVVNDTLQPASVSVWLRTDGEK